MKKPKTPPNQICANKKAFFEYFIEERFEAGLVLEGWEVKSIRQGKMSIAESYVIFKNGEAFLFGAHVQPLLSTSTHIKADNIRTKKLLLNRREIDKIIGAVGKKGMACVPLSCYWKGARVKCEIALVKGKKLHDKRQTLKERDFARDKARGFKNMAD